MTQDGKFAIITAFLSMTEKDIDDYIYDIYKGTGLRDAVRTCMKLYGFERVRAVTVVRHIIQIKEGK